MLFNSLHFLLFFPIVVLLYYLLKPTHRWTVLLIASYYFIASFRIEYAIIIAISTVVNYGMAIRIGRAKKNEKNKLLWVAIALNIAALVAFKYWNFFGQAAHDALFLLDIPFTPRTLTLLLPIGVSFYTFQNIGYLLDVHAKKVKAEKHIGHFAIFIALFPKIIAGPIERATTLLPQLKKPVFDADLANTGAQRMLRGFFKKIVIADSLALAVNIIYAKPTEYAGIPLILATIFFALQLYYDFSGYTDIALGVSAILGFRLLENFDRPYLSRSVAEFWRRWHMSLSHWFRDYLYFPLGGSRVSLPRWCFNILFVFMVTGFWHGANWTFIVWGALHGLFIVLGRLTQGARTAFTKAIGLVELTWLHAVMQTVITFALVTFAWIFFRAESLSSALSIITRLFTTTNYAGANLGVTKITLAIMLCSVALIEIWEWLLQKLQGKYAQPLSWSVHILLLVLILFFGIFHNVQFIYAQF